MFEDKDHSKYGARTIPSREIPQVDRSERSGEDLALTDRLQAATNVKEMPIDEKERAEEVSFKELQRQRKEWKNVVSEVDGLLKDIGNDED